MGPGKYISKQRLAWLNAVRTLETWSGRLGAWSGRLLAGLAVEPACFFFFFAYSSYSLGAQRLVIQKSCAPSGPPHLDFTCSQPELISRAADINTVRNVLGEALPGLMVFVAGSWRDASGLSRPLILWTIALQTLASGVFLTASQLWTGFPDWPSSLLESFLGGLSGGRQLLNLAAVCYISNRSSPADRTFRLTFYTVSTVGGLTLATAVSGYVLSHFGYAVFFGSIIGLYLISFLLAFVYIKEEPSKRLRMASHRKRAWPVYTNGLGPGLSSLTCAVTLWTDWYVGIFGNTGLLPTSIQVVKGENWLSCTKLLVVLRPKKNRAVIWLMIINSWLIYTAICGETNLSLFYLAKTYGFTVTESGIFLSFQMMLTLLSTVVICPILIKVLRWSDFSIGIFGTLTMITAVVSVYFTKSVLMLCIVGSMDVMRYSLLTAQRSIITKCLPNNELGTYWSFVAIGEAAMPMLVLPIYDIVFKKTLTTHLGSHYLVSAGIGFIALANLCLAKRLFKTKDENEKPNIVDPENQDPKKEANSVSNLDSSKIITKDNFCIYMGPYGTNESQPCEISKGNG